MRGVALPSWLVAVCAAVVALALVGFVVTGDRDGDVEAAPDTGSTAPPSSDTGNGSGAGDHAGQGGPDGHGDHGDHGGQGTNQPVERRTAYVEVYNNSGISGLASDTGAVLQDSGWRVVATDNWYGEIPANTVYYPSRLKAQAGLLARDLGISRVHPAVSPMSFDRLTVILVGSP